MNDYKELIGKLVLCATRGGHSMWSPAGSADLINVNELMLKAGNAIEQLVKERDELTTKCCRLEQERDAAVADLSMHGRYCITCAHSTTDGTYVWPCNDKRSKCATDDNKNWEWRGVQENNDEKHVASDKGLAH